MIAKYTTNQCFYISQNLHEDLLKLIFPFTNWGNILLNFRTDDSTIPFSDPALCTRQKNNKQVTGSTEVELPSYGHFSLDNLGEILSSSAS